MLQFRAEWWATAAARCGQRPAARRCDARREQAAVLLPQLQQGAGGEGDFERLQQALRDADAERHAADSDARPDDVATAAASSPASPAPGMARPGKAHIETQWLRALKDKSIPEIPVKCEWRPDERAMMAEVYPHSARMNWYMTSQLAPRGISRWPQSPATSTSPTTFNNVLLHEEWSITRAATRRKMAYTTVACCGEDVPDRAAACAARRSHRRARATRRSTNSRTRCSRDADFTGPSIRGFHAIRPQRARASCLRCAGGAHARSGDAGATRRVHPAHRT